MKTNQDIQVQHRDIRPLYSNRPSSEDTTVLNETESSDDVISGDSLMELIDPVLFIQEQERRRISEALHNDLGQLLYSIRLSVAQLKSANPSEEFRNQFEKIEKLVTEGIDTTRKISFELMPSLLKDFGLKSSIEELCKKLSNEKLRIIAKIEIGDRYNEIFETSVFRIVQELLNNVVKHSEANVATVSITQDSFDMNIVVEDNGKGFKPEQIKSRGLGLGYIKNRIQHLQGEIIFLPAPLKGTIAQIKISLP